jgi:hypothetical protein
VSTPAAACANAFKIAPAALKRLERSSRCAVAVADEAAAWTLLGCTVRCAARNARPITLIASRRVRSSCSVTCVPLLPVTSSVAIASQIAAAWYATKWSHAVRCVTLSSPHPSTGHVNLVFMLLVTLLCDDGRS